MVCGLIVGLVFSDIILWITKLQAACLAFAQLNNEFLSLDEPSAGGAAIRAISVLACNNLSGTLEKEIYTAHFVLPFATHSVPLKMDKSDNIVLMARRHLTRREKVDIRSG